MITGETMSKPALSIVIPVYNEAANFPALRDALAQKIQTPFDAYVVYDFDEDNTVPIVRQAIESGDARFHLVKNSIRRGVVGALLAGFRQVSSGPLIVAMGDLSDDLSIVDEMVTLHGQGFHVVSASRYMPGGKLVGGPFLKRNMSRWAGLTLHWLRGMPTHDATNSFKLYDARMLNSFTLESQGGFELSLEITVKAFLAGYCITEVPTTWRDRTAGESRFKLWNWLPRYLRWYFHAFRRKAILRDASDGARSRSD